jgi:hypothetical protein
MNLDSAILDLIIERSTCGLSSNDQIKLDQLIQNSNNPDAVLKEIDLFELSIAALELSQINDDATEQVISNQASLNPAIKEQIRVQAIQAIGVNAAIAATNPANPIAPKAADDRVLNRPATPLAKTPTDRDSSLRGIFIWTIAAASLLALAMFIRQGQSFEPSNALARSSIDRPVVPPADLVDDIMPNDEQMKKFLGSTPEDLLTLSWAPVDNKNVTGEVFWSDQQQTGFMTLQGLEVNDPQQKQYQVWIYDTDTKERRPVNGGVFDMPKSGRYVVPIAPLSPVKKAVQFSITTEQPGGVDVSQRNNIPTVASQPF